MVLAVAVGVLLALLAVLALAAFYAYRIAFYSPKDHVGDDFALPQGEQYEADGEKMRALIREMAALPFEQVRIRAFDGVELCGRYYHVRDGAPLQIQIHGYRGTAVRDFCGGNKLAREGGFNTLVVDQRAHGHSGGRTISFGIRERFDCKAWADYAFERFGRGTPIVLCGVSMGAATVLMASELPLPETVAGVVADCPYSAPEDILRETCRQWKLPVKPTVWLLRLAARIYGGFDLRAASAVEAVKNTRLPVLLIHGEDDRLVPCEMSRRLAQACGGYCRLETFPGAGHGLSFIADEGRYASAVREFLEFCLKGSGGR